MACSAALAASRATASRVIEQESGLAVHNDDAVGNVVSAIPGARSKCEAKGMTPTTRASARTVQDRVSESSGSGPSESGIGAPASFELRRSYRTDVSTGSLPFDRRNLDDDAIHAAVFLFRLDDHRRERELRIPVQDAHRSILVL